MNLRSAVVAAVVVAVGLSVGVAEAAEIDVKVLNKGAAGPMVIEPSLIKVAPGDTVKFVAVDKGHNVESIPGMLPDGAAPIASKMNEDVSVTLDKPGVYGVRCKPHYGMGMVALVVVGDPVNLDAAKAVKQPGKAKQVFEGLFAQLGK